MSKLPNAPLLEVIFELRWQIKNKSDLLKYQYLHGDLYSKVKNKYPYRESLVPPEVPIDVLINNPVHRFRFNKNDYPLIQVGPGLLTLNTVDSKYHWEEFFDWSSQLVKYFLEVFPFNDELFSPSLLYLDFFKFDFKNENVHDFISRYLSIDLKQRFLKSENNPNSIDLGFYYEIDLGNLSVTLKKGQNEKKEEGIVMQTMLHSKSRSAIQEDILSWLMDAHNFSSKVFKEITKSDRRSGRII